MSFSPTDVIDVSFYMSPYTVEEDAGSANVYVEVQGLWAPVSVTVSVSTSDSTAISTGTCT